MKLLLTCRYCNFKWESVIYSNDISTEKCWKCGDTNIDVKDFDKTKIDGYIGCKPFPNKESYEETGNTDFPFHYRSD